MNIENNKQLFLAGIGLVASGSNGHDPSDAEVLHLVSMVRSAAFPNVVTDWFACARTGQVTVNPYWPRGSFLAAACFFINDAFHFDRKAFFAFLESTGSLSDPIGIDDFMAWVSEAPAYLRLLHDHPLIPAIWDEYCQIIDKRSHKWRAMIDDAVGAANSFISSAEMEMVFNPNLFQPYSADFVRIGNRIVTISSTPDAETMLHETMHTVIARHREKILAFAVEHGLASFANRDTMMELGYMEDESATSIAHVIEECFVRALSVVLSGGSEERLQFHARYGCDSVPFIAQSIRREKTTSASLERLITVVFQGITTNRPQ
jgi:hypothetical protein